MLNAPGRGELGVVGRTEDFDYVVWRRSPYARHRADLCQKVVHGLLRRLQLEDVLARGVRDRLVRADNLRACRLGDLPRQSLDVRRATRRVHYYKHIAPHELKVRGLRLRTSTAAVQEQEEQGKQQFHFFHSHHHPLTVL